MFMAFSVLEVHSGRYFAVTKLLHFSFKHLHYVNPPFRHLHIQVGQGAPEGVRVVLSSQQGED